MATSASTVSVGPSGLSFDDVVAPPGRDRYLAPDLAAAEDLVRTGAVLDRVAEVIGPLA